MTPTAAIRGPKATAILLTPPDRWWCCWPTSRGARWPSRRPAAGPLTTLGTLLAGRPSRDAAFLALLVGGYLGGAAAALTLGASPAWLLLVPVLVLVAVLGVRLTAGRRLP